MSERTIGDWVLSGTEAQKFAPRATYYVAAIGDAITVSVERADGVVTFVTIPREVLDAVLPARTTETP